MAHDINIMAHFFFLSHDKFHLSHNEIKKSCNKLKSSHDKCKTCEVIRDQFSRMFDSVDETTMAATAGKYFLN